MNRARYLADQLEPFITGKNYRCMSEIDSLLIQISTYLDEQSREYSARVDSTQVDPTIINQMNLLLDVPTMSYRVPEGDF